MFSFTYFSVCLAIYWKFSFSLNVLFEWIFIFFAIFLLYFNFTIGIFLIVFLFYYGQFYYCTFIIVSFSLIFSIVFWFFCCIFKLYFNSITGNFFIVLLLSSVFYCFFILLLTIFALYFYFITILIPKEWNYFNFENHVLCALEHNNLK